MGAGESNMISSSTGVETGVGDATSICKEYAALWGRGDISISSVMGPGDDDGNGGVVMESIEI